MLKRNARGEGTKYRYSINLENVDSDIRELAEAENRTYANMIQTLLKEAIKARKQMAKYDNPGNLVG